MSQYRFNVTSEELAQRFGFHKGTAKTGPMHQDMRKKFEDFANFLNNQLPEGRAKSVTLTELENASMWANKAIAQLAPLVDE